MPSIETIGLVLLVLLAEIGMYLWGFAEGASYGHTRGRLAQAQWEAWERTQEMREHVQQDLSDRRN